MKKKYKILIIVFILFIVGMVSLNVLRKPNTALNKGTAGIAVKVTPADWKVRKLDKLPQLTSSFKNSKVMDLRSKDLSEADIGGKEKELLNSSFDSKTKWPQNITSVFLPEKIMSLGKNPGLGIRTVHNLGVNGKNIGIAIIDQRLLVNHDEYKDNVKSYEELHCGRETSMHGAAVASIAVGKKTGIAPKSDLYYIGQDPIDICQKSKANFNYTAHAINRIIELNKKLPRGKKIRVISISIGWGSRDVGYNEVVKAVDRAKEENIFVVSSSLKDTYGFKFNGLGRNPLSDPDASSSYTPGLFWQNEYYEGKYNLNNTLLIPMDSRCTASPTGYKDYVFYREGGWSWSIPYIAGIYALSCEVKPSITPDEFWRTALKTGSTVKFGKNSKLCSSAKIINPLKLIQSLKNNS
ncbi:S8 family serine peptidase [Clostridium sp. JNZ X4-2]